MDDSTFLHPLANVNSDKIGRGTRIWAFVTVQPGSIVGDDCQVCDHAGIGVDAVIGNRVTIKEYAAIGQGTVVEDDAFIGPGAITPNDSTPRSPRMEGFPQVAKRYEDAAAWLKGTRIGKGASIGTGVIISPGLDIGNYSLVGNGAIVTKDVPAHRMVVGHPARGIAWVCFCAVKLEAGDEEGTYTCPECKYLFRKTESGIEHVPD